MDFHPYSEIFPLLPDAELKELGEDIKAFGLREAIWLYEGQILDGRNRWLACQRVHVDPQCRTYKGTDAGALALVISANLKRRQLTESQRASAAAKIAKFRHGGHRKSDQAANLPLETQASAAEKFKVSERSVRAAHKVHEKGSKALNDALDAGEIPVSRAAAVTHLPKPKQLAAAKAKPPKEEPSPPELAQDWEPPEDEAVRLAAIEREQRESLDKLIDADDKLAAAVEEIKRQGAEIAVLKQSRDGYMNGRSAVLKLLKAEQRETAKLRRRVKELESRLGKDGA